MPVVSVTNPPPSTTAAAQGKTGAVIPFTNASWDHEEPFYDFTQALSSSTVTSMGPVDVASFGWMRGLWLRVTSTGGSSSGTVTATGDAPWNVISGLTMTNPNGQPYFGPVNGYAAACIRRFGATKGTYDNPLGGIFATVGTASGAGTGNFDFFLYIPAEIVGRNGIGSLANENAQASYQLSWTQNASTTVFTGTPGTMPSIRYRFYLDAWAPPPPQDVLGNMNTIVPPGNGTIQYWTSNGQNVVPNGQYNLPLTRKGQYIRNLIFIARQSSGARDATVFPDPVQMWRDGYIVTQLTQARWAEKMCAWYGLNDTASPLTNGTLTDARPNLSTSQWYGVFVMPYSVDLLAIPGDELRGKWMASLQATRLELVGSYSVGAGSTGQTVEIVTNDVAVPGDIFSRVLL